MNSDSAGADDAVVMLSSAVAVISVVEFASAPLTCCASSDEADENRPSLTREGRRDIVTLKVGVVPPVPLSPVLEGYVCSIDVVDVGSASRGRVAIDMLFSGDEGSTRRTGTRGVMGVGEEAIDTVSLCPVDVEEISSASALST